MRLIAAILFLTRIPVPGKWTIGSKEIGRSTVFFPLVGAGIGGLQWLVVWAVISLSDSLGKPNVVSALVLAALLVALETLITGALHLDGLADMTDGFGGGRTRDDVLRIMRDHCIGAFGAIALMLAIILKTAAIYTLIERGAGLAYLVVAPALARWTVVVLAFFLPYARTAESGLGEALTEHVGLFELLASTCIAIAVAASLLGWYSGVCLLLCAIASGWSAWRCKRRIQGVTGDTLGANIVICETLVLTAGSILISF